MKITKKAAQAAQTPAPVDVKDDLYVERGSVEAKALHAFYTGSPVIVVKSPPGGGKSTLITRLIHQIVSRPESAEDRVQIVTPTRAAAINLAMTMGKMLGGSATRRVVGLQDSLFSGSPDAFEQLGIVSSAGLHRYGLTSPEDTVMPRISTLASLVRQQTSCDVLIVDEAYQSTFTDVVIAAQNAGQIIMVGDPGQIGPVVQVDTSNLPSAIDPAGRAPEEFTARAETTVLSIDASYRLGAETCEVIAELYDFPFVSYRQEMYLSDPSGEQMYEIEQFQVDSAGNRDHQAGMEAVAEHARELVNSTLTLHDEDGNEIGTRPMTQDDVAVVVSHNSQQVMIRALLDGMGLYAVTVGTADSLQGGQWYGVVSLDPLFGNTEASTHSASLGRLCVMLSRHRAHLRWVHDGQWEQTLMDDQVLDQAERTTGLSVRRNLVGL